MSNDLNPTFDGGSKPPPYGWRISSISPLNPNLSKKGACAPLVCFIKFTQKTRYNSGRSGYRNTGISKMCIIITAIDIDIEDVHICFKMRVSYFTVPRIPKINPAKGTNMEKTIARTAMVGESFFLGCIICGSTRHPHPTQITASLLISFPQILQNICIFPL